MKFLLTHATHDTYYCLHLILAYIKYIIFASHKPHTYHQNVSGRGISCLKS